MGLKSTLKCQQKQLVERYLASRDPLLKDEVVKGFRRLADYLAMKFDRSGRFHEDLVQESLIGLSEALDRFDPGRGIKFNTYARAVMIGKMQHYRRDSTRMVKIPAWLEERLSQIFRAIESLAGQLGREPTMAEVGQHLGVSESVIGREIGQWQNSRTISLDEKVSGDDESMLLAEVIGGDDLTLIDVESSIFFAQLISCLITVEQRVIDLKYRAKLSQVEIAKRLKISQMQVSRHEQRALRRLREVILHKDHYLS